MCVLKGTNTIDEAVDQFYENPNKYSHNPVPSMSNPVNHPKDTKTPVDAPPSYAPSANTMSGSVPSMSNPVDHPKDTKTQVYSPPSYAPSANTMSGQVPSMSNPVDHPKDTKTQVYSPPSYAPPANTMSGPRRRPHTNVVIEAGNIRARDEVRFTLTSVVVMS
jgi:hypothetical protein